jgi:hypothetical protein
MYLFYKGGDSTTLYQMHFDGKQWTGNFEIRIEAAPRRPVHAPRSDASPAAAAPSTGVMLLYKGDGANDLYWARQLGPSSWTGDEKIVSPNGSFRPPTSDHSPAATIFRNFLFMIFKSADSNDLNAAAMNTFGHWDFSNSISGLSKGAISPKSDVRPSAAAFNDKLFVVYKGVSTSNLYLTTFDGVHWSGDTRISSLPGGITPESTDSPGLAVYQNRLYMVYKSPNNNDLNYAFFDGAAWHGNSEIWKQPGGIRPQSTQNPALILSGNLLYMFYKSPNNNDLNYAYFDGSAWHGNSAITMQNGTKPQSNASPAAALG